jgi:hypothetical protein
MFRKIALALSAAAMTALPVAAEAHGYYGGYGYGYPSYGYGGYGYPAYGYGNYGYRPYGYSYGYRPSYYGYDRYRCNRNTAAGALIGGVAGALIGRSVARGGHYSYRYGYYRHGDRRAGTLIGGAVGAVAGGAIASSNCY